MCLIMRGDVTLSYSYNRFGERDGLDLEQGAEVLTHSWTFDKRGRLQASIVVQPLFERGLAFALWAILWGSLLWQFLDERPFMPGWEGSPLLNGLVTAVIVLLGFGLGPFFVTMRSYRVSIHGDRIEVLSRIGGRTRTYQVSQVERVESEPRGSGHPRSVSLVFSDGFSQRCGHLDSSFQRLVSFLRSQGLLQ